MISRPQFKPWCRCEVVPSEGVILLSERKQLLLRGEPYLQLAPLLKEQYTVDEILSRVTGVSATEVFYALELLEQQGWLMEGGVPLPSEQAAFWDGLGIDSEVASRRLQDTTVSVLSFGQIDPAPFYSLLLSLGIRISNDSEHFVVLTDDYLREELAAFNQAALGRDRSWLLTKPVGSELWFGPLFVPGKTGCWTCLAHRLRGTRKVESYLAANQKTREAFLVPPAALPTTVETALSIAATEIAKWAACGHSACLEGKIVTLNMHSFEINTHVLVRRPQCLSCGEHHALAARQFTPLVLQSRKQAFTEGVGYSNSSPQDTLQKLVHHVSPLTGIVSSLLPASPWVEKTCLVPCYVTSHNFVELFSEAPLAVTSLRSNLQAGSAGKGKCDVQAKASALCESIERYSGVFQGDEGRLTASFTDLGEAAIHVNSCMLFSQQQFTNRQHWNVVGSEFAWVPEPFDLNATVEWSPVWSLNRNVRSYIPTAYCYYGYSQKVGAWFARADSNGCAAGPSIEDAILQGFMELVERDSVALWWYNRLQKPTVDLSSFSEPYCRELEAYYRTLHRDLWLLDITSDLNIPSFAAVSRRNNNDTEDIIFGFGAHFDPRMAILRALTEVNQSLHAVVARSKNESCLHDNPAAVEWWATATLENQNYLVPEKNSTPKVQEDYPRHRSDDLLADIMTCVRIAQEHGLEILVLDQTRPDTGLHVVKVFVPGLRHFWPRLGPGRLYDVPVSMGWLAKRLTEDELNPSHIYF